MSEELGTSCLEKAKTIINGQRQDDYGVPERSFNAIADLWNAYLLNKRHSENIEENIIRPSDVAIMMALLKVARLSYRYKEDNAIDIIGYTAIYDEIMKEEIKTNGEV